MKNLTRIIVILTLAVMSACSVEPEDEITPDVEFEAPVITLSDNSVAGMPGDEVVVTIDIEAEAGIDLFTVNEVSIASAIGQTSFTYEEVYTIQNSDDVVTFEYFVQDTEQQTVTETLTVNQGSFTLPTIELDETDFNGVAGDTAFIRGIVEAEAGIKELLFNNNSLQQAIGETTFEIDTFYVLQNSEEVITLNYQVVDNVDKKDTATVTITQSEFALPIIELNETEFSGNLGDTAHITGSVTAEAGIKSLTVNGVEIPEAVSLTSFEVDTIYVFQNSNNTLTFDVEVVDNVDETASETVTITETSFEAPTVNLTETEFTGQAGDVATSTVNVTAEAGIKSLTINGEEISEATGQTSFEYVIEYTLVNTDDEIDYVVEVVDNVDETDNATFTITQNAFEAPTVNLTETEFSGIANEVATSTVTVTAEAGIASLTINGEEISEAVNQTSFEYTIEYTLVNEEAQIDFNIVAVDNVDETDNATFTVIQSEIEAPTVTLSSNEFTGFTGNEFSFDVTVSSQVDVTLTVNGNEVALANGVATITETVTASDREELSIVVTDELGQTTTDTFVVLRRNMSTTEQLLIGNWNAWDYAGNDGRFMLNDDNVVMSISTDLTITFSKDNVVFLEAEWFTTTEGVENFINLENVNIVNSSIASEYSYLQTTKRKVTDKGISADTNTRIISLIDLGVNRVDFTKAN